MGWSYCRGLCGAAFGMAVLMAAASTSAAQETKKGAAPAPAEGQAPAKGQAQPQAQPAQTPAPQANKHRAARATRVRGRTRSLRESRVQATLPATATAGGFRLEGEPDIAVVFGDSARFRTHVDSFFQLREDMSTARAEFTQYVRAAVATLAAHRRGGCPTDAVAPLVTRAYDAGQRFRELGAELEGHAQAISSLHDLGEMTSLTPDYRWKVNRARQLFKLLLVDYREMRSVFENQLGSELEHRGCSRDVLIAAGRKILAEIPNYAAVMPAPEIKKNKRLTLPVEQTPAATYFIDNTRCQNIMRLVVDGAVVGDVDAGARAAFQTPAGRHTLCLLPSTSQDNCGDPGTVRTSYIHDGWSITVRCD